MIDVLRIAHLRIAPQEGNSEVGNCEVHHGLGHLLARQPQADINSTQSHPSQM